jgi:hypothetical protein
MITMGKDSAQIVHAFRDRLAELGLLHAGESRNNHIARALEECTLITKADLKILLDRLPVLENAEEMDKHLAVQLRYKSQL